MSSFDDEEESDSSPNALKNIIAKAQRASFAMPSIDLPSEQGSRDLALAKIPVEFRNASFDDAFADSAASRVARHQRPGIVHFYGPTGTGKTTLATALYKAELELLGWNGGAWISANDLVIDATRETKLGGESRLKRRAFNASILLLDDVGEESIGDLQRATIVSVVSYRHRNHRPTITTAGIPLRQDPGSGTIGMLERYGAGLVRRLTEPGRATVIRCVRTN